MEHVDLHCDILVAGGGPAGVPAALAAARLGAKVILCQDRSVLGGNASSEVRMHIVGADASGARGVALETEAREGGIIEEIRLENAVHNPQRSASMFDLILYDKCRMEPNITLLLDTAVVGAEVEHNSITKAIAERQSTEHRFFIHADVFIDCTGDGRLGVEAGAVFRHGRESKEAFHEKLAQETADEKTLGSTLLFQARKADGPMPFRAPTWARKFSEEDLKFRPHAKRGVDRGLEYGYWWVEWGGQLNTIKDNAAIRDELLAIMLGVWDHIKNHGDHGADEWALEWFGFLPGKRESRRFIGQYTLKESDLMESKAFHDAIAFGGWPLDLHPPEGIDAVNERPAKRVALPFLYDIPLRSCIAKDLDNLMFAGRNISASHVAFGSTRVMATCAVVGQGVGTAAAMAVKNDIVVAALPKNEHMLHRVQQQLLKDDAYLIGISNDDPDDMSRIADITSSSEQKDGPATNVVSGQTRATFGKGGAPPERTVKNTHRWMSDPSQGLPAWVQLQWNKAIQLKEIRLIFDTGLHRPLTLSHSDAYLERMKWGRPQPETIKTYSVSGLVNGVWKTLINETDNYERMRIHRIDGKVAVMALRITCHETHGIDHARICEIRVYEE